MDLSTERYVWLNGELLQQSAAAISPFDHGFTTGDGVFEAIISYNGAPFALTRHWRRLVKSGQAMGICVPDREVFANAIPKILAANQMTDARIRITVTGGISPLGSEKGHGSETVVIAVAERPQRPAIASVITVPFTRNENSALAGVKSTSYGENVAALAYAKARGGQEAIFPNTKGHLCEGTGSNVFLMLDGELLTPTLASGCLTGVTRSIVLDICKAEGIAVIERDIPITALPKATEAFLTSTFREVQPIGAVDGAELPAVPGPMTTRIQSAFKALTAVSLDP